MEEEASIPTVSTTRLSSLPDPDSGNRLFSPHVHELEEEEENNDEKFEKTSKSAEAPIQQQRQMKRATTDDTADDFSESLLSRADSKLYRWAKVKGSPFWPCQEIDLCRFKQNLPEFVREKVDVLSEEKNVSVELIQFFGTNEYMWRLQPKKNTEEKGINNDETKNNSVNTTTNNNNRVNNCGIRKLDVESFRSGCEKGYHKNITRVGLKKAVQEMRECLQNGVDPQNLKKGGLQWHTNEIAAEEEEKKKPEKKKKKKATSTKRKKEETKKSSEEEKKKKAKKSSKEGEKKGKGTVVASAAAAVAAAVKMEFDAAKVEEKKRDEPPTLENLFDDKIIEEKPFQLTFDVLSVRDPPPFERLRRNRWVSRQGPKQVHKSESVVCYCRPIPTSLKEEMIPNVTTERAIKMTSTSSLSTVVTTTTATNAVVAVVPPMDAITNKLAAGEENQQQVQQQPQQISEENGPATPPELIEDPMNGGNAKNTKKKAPKAKPAPRLRLGCGQDCVNRETRYTCDSRVCPCGDDCSNRPFQYLPQPKVKVQLTENRGYGLFLQQDVFAGDFIVEYMGEIIDDEECSRRLLACKDKNEPNFYLMEITPSQIIDARFCGNNARFINSSCYPNCETQRWVDASTNETRVGIFAIEDIKSGTELTYDYNFAHFGGEGTTSFTCFCGHPMCKGTLDANPERMRRFMDRVTVIMKNGDVKTGTVLEYTVNKKYKLILDDEEEVKLWSKTTKSEEEKAELAMKKTKNRKYVTVNLDNVDTANDAKKGGKKLECVWLTNRTNFKEATIAKKNVAGKKKKKNAKASSTTITKKKKKNPTTTMRKAA